MNIETESQVCKDHHKQDGYVRHMVTLPEAHKLKLKQIAKQYAIIQGEVIEVMLNQIDLNQHYSMFADKRIERVNDRKTTTTALVKKIKNLTPEQRTAIEFILSQAGV